MADLDSNWQKNFPSPNEGPLGLELVIEADGKPASLELASVALNSLWTCKRYVEASDVFIRWHRGERPIGSPRAREAAEELDRFLNRERGIGAEFGADFRFESVRRLELLAEALGSLSRIGFVESDLDIQLLSAEHFNPTVLKFVIYAGAGLMALVVITWGGVQLIKESGSPECRAKSQEIFSQQLNVFEHQARLEGRWTPELRKSHEFAVKAAQATTAACGSALEGLGLRLKAGQYLVGEVQAGSR